MNNIPEYKTEDLDYLEELWTHRDETSARYASFQEYFKDLMRYQRETHPEWYKDDSSSLKNETVHVVAEDPVDYHA